MSKKERKELNKQAAELNEQELDNVSGGYTVLFDEKGVVVTGVNAAGYSYTGVFDDIKDAQAAVKKQGLEKGQYSSHIPIIVNGPTCHDIWG